MQAKLVAPPADLRRLSLERLSGKIGAGACWRLAKVMRDLGCDLTRGGYLEQVRGYAREAGNRIGLSLPSNKVTR